MNVRVISCLPALLLVPMIRGQAVVTPDAAELDAFIAKNMGAYGVPGTAVAVVRDGKVLIAKGYGVRDFSKPGAVDENTLFQLASVTKTFTGALCGSLVDAGKMSFDKSIIDYLPEFVDYDTYITRHMTVRDLLAHRTGWPAFKGDLMDNLGYSRAEILQRIRHFEPAFTFRWTATYSNIGYFVAGETAGRAGGASWNDLMKTRVLSPIGLNRTYTRAAAMSDPNATKAHALVDGKMQLVTMANQDTMGAAGSMSSCASDMAKYMMMYLDEGKSGANQVLKPDTVNALFERSMISEISFTELPPISDTTGFYYGMGFGTYDYADHRIIEKGGALAGVRTVLVMVPELNAGIIVMSNLNFTSFPEAVRAFWLDKLLGRPTEVHQAAILKINSTMINLLKTPERPKTPKPFGYPLSALVGTYENPMYGQFTISMDGDKLKLLAGPARAQAELYHWGGGQFEIQWPTVTAGPSDTWFTIGEDGMAVSFLNEDLGEFKRVKK